MQNRKLAFRTGAGILAVAAVIFLNQTGKLSAVKNIFIKGLSPLTNFSSDLRFFLYTRQTSAWRQTQEAKVLRLELENIKEENDKLRQVINFKEKNNIEFKGAGVKFYGQELGREFLLLDRGRNEGIKEDDLVTDENFILVGIVKETGSDFSKVEISSNPGQNFEIKVAGKDLKALAEGLGARTFNLKLVPRDADLKQGDLISLFNSGSKSILLAEVVNIKVGGGKAFLDVKAVGLGKPELLKNVFIISWPAK